MTQVARENYANQLQTLRDLVINMSSMVDKAIARSVDALRGQDFAVAEQVIADDRKINEARWKVEELALLIIATQAPMATDLRLISSVIHIATELERMADHAAGNAKIVLQTADEPLLKPLVDLPRMADYCREMLSDSITALIERDADAALATIEKDDLVDDLYNQVYRELLTYMMADPGTINRATHLLWAAHNIERIGDRVTNICERVVFAVTGSLEATRHATY
ncbi:MAG: phosphate signaling complex protein PhoU [Chloroflexota bacterium]|nr:phosphate signaling complex protein PhoU [Chloroflexota bacterium]